MNYSQPLYYSLKELSRSQNPRLSVATDLLTHPLEKLPTDCLAPERLTQLLVGETIKVLEKQEGWMRVQALHQPKWSEKEGRFVAYEGWIQSQVLQEPKSDVSAYGIVTSHLALVRKEPSFDAQMIATPEMGSLLSLEFEEEGWHRVQLGTQMGWIYDKDVAGFDWMEDQSEASWRWQWCESALRYRSCYYLLGGMGLFPPAQGRRGIDCSGLIHLVARRLGLLIPRDSRDQYRWFKQGGLTSFSLDQLQPGDLLFLSDSHEEAIDHVMMYQGEGEWLESTRTYGGFWESTTESRFGELKPGLLGVDGSFRVKEGFHSTLQRKNVYPVMNKAIELGELR